MTRKSISIKIMAITLAGSLLLTGCMGNLLGGNKPAPKAVSITDHIHGMAIHTGGDDFPLDSPKENLQSQAEKISDFAASNGMNTIYFDSTLQWNSLYKTQTMPLHPKLLDDKGKSLGAYPLETMVEAAAKKNLQVYAALPIFITDNPDSLGENHIAVINKDATVLVNGNLFWDISKPEARNILGIIVGELAMNTGISGIVIETTTENKAGGTTSEYSAALQALVNELKDILDALGTGKTIGVSDMSGSSNSAPADSAALDAATSCDSIDFLLLGIDTPVGGGYENIIAGIVDKMGVKSTKLIPMLYADSLPTVNNTNMPYKDPYELNYQLYTNTSHKIDNVAINGYSSVKDNQYYPLQAMHSMLGVTDLLGAQIDLSLKNGFAITQPSKDITTYSSYNKYFLDVISDPNKPLYFGGKEVDRKTNNGLYGVLVDLEYGDNTFTFSQDGISKSVTIARPKPATGSAVINTITAKSMFPAQKSGAKIGEELTLKCTAPAGAQVYATVAGSKIELQQKVATAKNGIPAVFTGTLTFADNSVPSNEVKNIGKVTYTLHYNGNVTSYQSGGDLYAVGQGAQLVMEVADYMAGVTIDETKEHEGDFIVSLPEGARDYVTASTDNHFLLASGGAVQKSAVNLLEGSNTVEKTITGITHKSSDKGDYFTLSGADGSPWHPSMTADTLKLKVYGVNSVPTSSLEGSDFGLSSAVKQSDGSFELTFTTKNGNTFWGYDVTYENGDMLIYCKKKPVLSTGALPLENLTIMIDPGHGGYDPGALGSAYKFGPMEAELNMAVSTSTKAALERMGANVILTHSPKEYTDTKLVLFDRMKIAKEHDADLFLSMHHNSMGENVNANNSTGTEVYYFTDFSKNLADTVAANVTAATGRKNRGASKSYYVVTKMTYCPAILSELGFIVNPVEYEQLSNPMVIYRTANSYVKSVFDIVR